jgi:hypothetical protein
MPVILECVSNSSFTRRSRNVNLDASFNFKFRWFSDMPPMAKIASVPIERPRVIKIVKLAMIITIVGIWEVDFQTILVYKLNAFNAFFPSSYRTSTTSISPVHAPSYLTSPKRPLCAIQREKISSIQASTLSSSGVQRPSIRLKALPRPELHCRRSVEHLSCAINYRSL